MTDSIGNDGDLEQYHELSNAPDHQGSVVEISGDGNDKAGVYRYTDQGWIEVADAYNTAAGQVPHYQGDGTISNQMIDESPLDEFGRVDHGDVSAGASSTVSESFSEFYNLAPFVLASAGSTASIEVQNVHGSSENVGTDGFDHVVYNESGDVQTVDRCAWVVAHA